MKLSYSLVTFNGMGGHPMLSFVGDFLLVDAVAVVATSVATPAIATSSTIDDRRNTFCTMSPLAARGVSVATDKAVANGAVSQVE